MFVVLDVWQAMLQPTISPGGGSFLKGDHHLFYFGGRGALVYPIMPEMPPTDEHKTEIMPPRRVLLLFPQLNNLVFFGVYEPLVMEIFSAIAKEEGCEVELVDLRLDPHGCERLARRGYVPDMIALTTHGFPEVPIVNGCARNCKQLWPESPIVIGGGQATVTPELFEKQYIDMIVRGPGARLA